MCDSTDLNEVTTDLLKKIEDGVLKPRKTWPPFLLLNACRNMTQDEMEKQVTTDLKAIIRTLQSFLYERIVRKLYQYYFVFVFHFYFLHRLSMRK